MQTRLKYHLETDYPPLIACFIGQQVETRLGRGELVGVGRDTVEAKTAVARWTTETPVKIDRRAVVVSQLDARVILTEVLAFSRSALDKWMYTSQPTPGLPDPFKEDYRG